MEMTLGVFILTLVFVIWKPRGLSIGWSALDGAIIALLIGVVHWQDVWAVTKIVWDATLTFISIIIFSTVLDKVGFFEWSALKIAHAAKGNGRLLFLYIVLLGAIVSAMFTNDGAALILTPIVLEKMKLLKFDLKRTIPFVLASGFIADTTSLPLVISNLVNIVSADYFHISFVHYVAHMLVPDMFSLAASVGMLFVVFYKNIPREYRPEELHRSTEVIKHREMFMTSWVALAILFLGYILTDLYRIPVSFMAGAIAIVFLIAGAKTKTVEPRQILRDAPWSVVVFSIGMCVVVYGLQNVGLTHVFGKWMQSAATHGLFTGTLVTGFLMALLSSVMNNLPSIIIGALSIHSTHVSLVLHEAMVYANVIGCDLGPKITPIGSLATLLWLHIPSKKGITITWGQYPYWCPSYNSDAVCHFIWPLSLAFTDSLKTSKKEKVSEYKEIGITRDRSLRQTVRSAHNVLIRLVHGL